jgi:hypothetical protein
MAWYAEIFDNYCEWLPHMNKWLNGNWNDMKYQTCTCRYGAHLMVDGARNSNNHPFYSSWSNGHLGWATALVINTNLLKLCPTHNKISVISPTISSTADNCTQIWEKGRTTIMREYLHSPFQCHRRLLPWVISLLLSFCLLTTVYVVGV